MGKLNIVDSVVINTNADKAWDIVGPNFLKISDWGRGINKSWENVSILKRIEDAPAAGRYCDVKGFGKFDERIIHYSSDSREISWSAAGKKLPNFLTGSQNVISVEEIDENSCRVHTNITGNLGGLGGFLMGPMMKANFTKVITGFLTDWKVYAETGKVSEVKQAELSKM